MNDVTKQALSKVPAVTLGFWVIKILATTLGETGGDTVTMTLDWGYLAGVRFSRRADGAGCRADLRQRFSGSCTGRRSLPRRRSARRSPTSPTDRGGSASPGGSLLLLFVCWPPSGCGVGSEGMVSVDTVSTPKVEAFYWATITFSQTLGTALGDWLANTVGLVMNAARWYSSRRSWRSSPCITGPGYRVSPCFGSHSS